MPEIIPFRGVLYNKKKIKNIAGVFAPPYDVISQGMQRRLYRKHKYNIVRLILGKSSAGDGLSENKYARAARFLNSWMEKGVFTRDAAPSFYVYAHNYIQDGRPKMRIGFVGLLKLNDKSKGAVFLHEKTYKKPKLDRLNLIKATRANLCSIFSLFADKGGRVSGILSSQVRSRPVFDVRNSGGVRHRLWRLNDTRLIRKIQEAMKDRDIFIADGHHRYEVALKYCGLMRRKNSPGNGCDYVMMYFLNLMDKGLLILPTHRLLKGAAGLKTDADVKDKFGNDFEIGRFYTQKGLLRQMPRGRRAHNFGLFLRPNRYYMLALKKASRELDVSILHNLIFKKILRASPGRRGMNISYAHDAGFASAEVKTGRCDAAFFLNPTKIEDVRRIASSGARMPHKSTYFYPKLLSGIVINKHG